MDALESVLESISHPIRLDILLAIAERDEVSYTELLPITESHQVTSSVLAYHLSELRDGLFVQKNKHKRYTLTNRGRTVANSLLDMSRQLATVEKRQWLQDGRATLLTRSHVAGLLNSMGVSPTHREAVASDVHTLLQTLPNQTVHPSLLSGIIASVLIDKRLYSFVPQTVSFGPSLLEVDPQDNDHRLSHRHIAKGLLDYFLVRYLPMEIQDNHYVGAINIENGRDPFRLHHLFVPSSAMDPLGSSDGENRFLTTGGLLALLLRVSNDVTIGDPGVSPSGREALGDPLNMIEACQIASPSETTLCYRFPEGLSPKSKQGRRILEHIRESPQYASMNRTSYFAPLYLLPSSAAFNDTHQEALAEVLARSPQDSPNARFGSLMFPWQKNLLYSSSGLRADVEEGQATGIAGFFTVNMGVIVSSSDGQQSTFEDLLRSSVIQSVAYFDEKERLVKPLISEIEEALRLVHCVNIYGLDVAAKRFTEQRLPRKDALSFVLDTLKLVEGVISDISDESGLDITFSSVGMRKQQSSLLNRAAQRRDEGSAGLLELLDEGLIHSEAVLQKFIPGGRRAGVGLMELSDEMDQDPMDILINLFTEEEFSFIPLRM